MLKQPRCGECEGYDPQLPYCQNNYHSRMMNGWGKYSKACVDFQSMPEMKDMNPLEVRLR